MLADAESLAPDACPGRHLVECRRLARRWHVVVEPDHESQLVIVVTA
jgi:hypothetical protein